MVNETLVEKIRNELDNRKNIIVKEFDSFTDMKKLAESPSPLSDRMYDNDGILQYVMFSIIPNCNQLEILTESKMNVWLDGVLNSTMSAIKKGDKILINPYSWEMDQTRNYCHHFTLGNLVITETIGKMKEEVILQWTAKIDDAALINQEGFINPITYKCIYPSIEDAEQLRKKGKVENIDIVKKIIIVPYLNYAHFQAKYNEKTHSWINEIKKYKGLKSLFQDKPSYFDSSSKSYSIFDSITTNLGSKESDDYIYKYLTKSQKEYLDSYLNSIKKLWPNKPKVMIKKY
ncbi:MAG: hypothetical protein Q8O89_08700 [Nanoarchaeota archaeon]|nr:hypothetical protein [Nanoarchaeota archaeon]